MTELNSTSLAQIVTTNDKAAAVFEKYQLDYCCNGKRSLQQACAEKELQVDQVISELQSVTNDAQTPLDFNKMSLTKLADYIVHTHHEYVKTEMPLILAYLQKVVAKHGERHPEMQKVFEAFTALKEEMSSHMEKEEIILFPRIRQLEKSAVDNEEFKLYISYLQSPINIMEQEHEYAGKLLEEMRQLTGNYAPPVDACTTYKLSFTALQAFEKDLHQHVHLENNILFPKTIELYKQVGIENLN